MRDVRTVAAIAAVTFETPIDLGSGTRHGHVTLQQGKRGESNESNAGQSDRTRTLTDSIYYIHTHITVRVEKHHTQDSARSASNSLQMQPFIVPGSGPSRLP
jgi:hypothetical protein